MLKCYKCGEWWLICSVTDRKKVSSPRFDSGIFHGENVSLAEETCVVCNTVNSQGGDRGIYTDYVTHIQMRLYNLKVWAVMENTV